MPRGFSSIPHGARRRIGLEIEFAGLTEDAAARLCAERFGGRAARCGPQAWRVSGGDLGEVKIYLDTALRGEVETALDRASLSLGRTLIPVEIVTEPLRFGDLPRVAALCSALRGAGAVGTEASPAFGFGVHFNIEIASAAAEDIVPVATAYALLEPWLRRGRQMDLTRRILPFAQPYPAAYTAALCASPPPDIGALADLYLAHNPTRNRGLDLLPLLAHLKPDQVRAALPEAEKVNARPAFHFRLPDSRIGDADWSLGAEWDRWAHVERLAAAPQTLRALADAWQAQRGLAPHRSKDWLQTLENAVKETA